VRPVCYRAQPKLLRLFPGSSVVEQPAVNRLVAGSNPARGAKQIKRLVQKWPKPKPQKNESGN
jgi:hypothetical protein